MFSQLVSYAFGQWHVISIYFCSCLVRTNSLNVWSLHQPPIITPPSLSPTAKIFCSVLPSASPLPPLNKTALQTKLPTGKFIRNFYSNRDLHGRWQFFCKEFLSSKNGQDTWALSCLISCFFFNFISSGSLVSMFSQFQNVKIYQASIQFSSDLGNTMHFCLELSTMKASWDRIRYEYVRSGYWHVISIVQIMYFIRWPAKRKTMINNRFTDRWYSGTSIL